MDLIHFISACFGIFANTIYLHHSLHICFKIFAQIRIQKFDLMQNKYIFSYWRIFASKYSYRSDYSKTLSEFHIQANICLQIFAYQQIFATHCFKLFTKTFLKSWTSINIRFFWKIFA